jgi:heme/copper-type cytochrome/quinol oxidase subunit 2
MMVLGIVGFSAGAYSYWHTRAIASLREGFQVAEKDVRIQVRGRQYKWYFRYPGPDRKFATPDDVVDVVLRVPAHAKVALQLTSLDVPHRLVVHRVGVSQDALPDGVTRAWFETGEPTPGNLPARDRSHDVSCGRAAQCVPEMRNAFRVVTREEFQAHLQALHQEEIDEEFFGIGEDEDGEDWTKFTNWGWDWDDLGPPVIAQSTFTPRPAPPLPDP